MKLTESERLLLDKIFTKIKYDQLNNRYTIRLEDYMPLNLSGGSIKLLKRMCEENNIYLEQLPERLTMMETKKLFVEYNNIKDIIASNPDSPNNIKLENMLIEIKQKIVLGHMRTLFTTIYKCVPDIENMPSQDRENIYQIGCETLIEFVDKYDQNRSASFLYFVTNYIMHYIFKKIYSDNKDLKNHQSEELQKLNRARQKLIVQKEKVTVENMAKELGMKKDKVTQLMALEKYVDTLELDGLDDTTEDLIDYDFEDRMIEDILNENDYINKLINCLPSQVKRVIELYYGFEDGKTYTYEEIGKKLGYLGKERARQLKETGLTLLANSIGSDYLKSIYGQTAYTKQRQEGINSIRESEKIIQDMLIHREPKENVLLMIEYLNPINKEIMLLYYGFKNGVEYDIKEISTKLGIKQSIISSRKKESTQILIKGLAKMHDPDIQGNYIEFLMNDYLNTTKKSHKPQ